MKVFVETNFVLEIALDQSEANACEELVVLAEHGRIDLVLPGFSFVEASSACQRRRQEVTQFAQQLRRPESLTRLPWLDRAVSDFRNDVVEAAAQSVDRLARITDRLLQCAQVLVLDADSLKASALLPEDCGLSPPDRLVLATVLAAMNAGGAGSLFLNRNTKDFEQDVVRAVLADAKAELIGSFQGGLNRVLKTLGTG